MRGVPLRRAGGVLVALAAVLAGCAGPEETAAPPVEAASTEEPLPGRLAQDVAGAVLVPVRASDAPLNGLVVAEGARPFAFLFAILAEDGAVLASVSSAHGGAEVHAEVAGTIVASPTLGGHAVEVKFQDVPLDANVTLLVLGGSHDGSFHARLELDNVTLRGEVVEAATTLFAREDWAATARAEAGIGAPVGGGVGVDVAQGLALDWRVEGDLAAFVVGARGHSEAHFADATLTNGNETWRRDRLRFPGGHVGLSDDVPDGSFLLLSASKEWSYRIAARAHTVDALDTVLVADLDIPDALVSPASRLVVV